MKSLSLDGLEEHQTEPAACWTTVDGPGGSRFWSGRPGPTPDFRKYGELLYTLLTALHRDAPAVWFLIPPTVRTLSLSLNTATSGAVASRGQQRERHPDTVRDQQPALTTHPLPFSTTVTTPGPASQHLHHLSLLFTVPAQQSRLVGC